MKMLWPVSLMTAIFLLSSIPGTSRDQQSWLLTDLHPTVQNALHVPLYGLLQWLWLRALVRPGRTLMTAVGLAALISLIYGCLDEFHQAFVPGRYASVQDVLLNTLGVAAGTWCFITCKNRLAVRHPGGHES